MGYLNSLGLEAALSRLWTPLGSKAMLVVLRFYSLKSCYSLSYFVWTDFCKRPDLYQINNLNYKFLVSFSRNMKFLDLFKILKYLFLYNGIQEGSNVLIAWLQVKKSEITVSPSQSPSVVLLPNSL